MANYQIPISYVVSASAVLPQAGLEPLKLSTILILTDEEPVTELTGDYEIYRTVTSAVKTWGTESTTTKMIQAIFGQSPNILNNNGYVIVAPFLNIPATSGTLTTPSINIENFKTISNGVINLTIDGINEEITALDFTDVETVTDIANVIESKITNATISVVNDTILFTSKITGTTSSVSILEATEAGTDLYGSEYLDGANCVEVVGTEQTKEGYSNAILRLADTIYFEGVLTSRFTSDSEVIEASNTVESLQPNRILFAESSNLDALTVDTGLFYQLLTNNFTKTLLYTNGENAQLQAKLFAAAYASKLLSVNYNGSNTCITMNLKDLSGIQADTNISESILQQCAGAGCDVYASVEGLPKVLSNRKHALYIDQVANQIWFVNTIQREVFNLLATTRTKIPQTESGMQLITNVINQICAQAITNGYGGAGKWNSADTFGDYDDFHRNIFEQGYYVYHLPVAQQIQSEREERRAPMFQIALKEAGAVHSANILIYVEP